ncbi:cytochrome D ubiquinol oxidase subunit II [Agrobacterium arsenijevicii]|uniref:Cytochrome D ubiquinol oxidase subunit II n=2 Tax=Agrobacterium arsenijevicii TaxID=1585697 RepID=A0ABR5D6B7_9HYPH|nr:cytochrome D ubiquinol oxidase subunit II [Agrobacterium arsenijevicii]
MKPFVRSLFLATSITLINGAISMTLAQTSVPSAQPEKQQTRAQQLMGDTAPKLAELTDEVLYNDIWERPEISKRDRSLVTITALIALNRPDQLRSHIRLGLQNGLTKEEIVETITHMAFYSGWPSGVSAVAIAKDVFAEK